MNINTRALARRLWAPLRWSRPSAARRSSRRRRRALWPWPLQWAFRCWRWPMPSATSPADTSIRLSRLGLIAAGRFDSGRAVPYIVAQCVGGIARRDHLLHDPRRRRRRRQMEHLHRHLQHLRRPGQFGLASAFLIEVVITALFLIVIVGATSRRAPAGFAPIAIGLALTLFHLVSIPVSNASLNPARSLATGDLRRRGRDRPALGVLGRTNSRSDHRRRGRALSAGRMSAV